MKNRGQHSFGPCRSRFSSFVPVGTCDLKRLVALKSSLSPSRSERRRQPGKVADLFRIVGTVEPVEPIPAHVGHALLENNVAGFGYLDDPVVELVANKRVAVVQA